VLPVRAHLLGLRRGGSPPARRAPRGLVRVPAASPLSAVRARRSRSRPGFPIAGGDGG
jgi:hypothetical protein